jgi:UDP-N-acetylglucosamine 4,6-dehydratase
MFDNESILITGGTGSFGKQFVETVLTRYSPRRVIVFSRDELKQFEMAQEPRFAAHGNRLRYFLGDVRDRERLMQAFAGVRYVVHAAALKQVPACEYNPFEAVKTNVLGAQYIIDAAIERGVEQVVALSTDKACNPVNLYGATKLCSDKLFIAGNAYSGHKPTRFSVVRYGNVVGSRGSVVPFFLKLKSQGRLPITHPDMTRFWITLEQGVQFVLDAFARMRGGELFVPKIPSMRITDLARAIAPDATMDIVGIRPGEKLHEMMISADDARRTTEHERHYVIEPEGVPRGASGGRSVSVDFTYSSDTNTEWLSVDDLRGIISKLDHGAGRGA